MAKKDLAFKTLLDEGLYNKLEKLHELTGLSRGQIVREAIEHRFAMQAEGKPTCANGRACFVAHLHLIQSDRATPVHNVTTLDEHRLVTPPRAANAHI